MARVDMRTLANKSGITYDASKTTYLYAEDMNLIKAAIDGAGSGINTEQVEISGVIVINSSGEIVAGTGAKPTKDKKAGSDCSGSDGDSSRVLTLTNTKTTKAVIVMLGGQYLAEDTDYTVSHLAASSTVTFTGAVLDAMKIEVVYFS